MQEVTGEYGWNFWGGGQVTPGSTYRWCDFVVINLSVWIQDSGGIGVVAAYCIGI